jgi:thymidylate synthase (FAD)
MRSDINVQLIDIMGDDDRVVDAARVSFNKTSDKFTPEQNARLIKYLATHNHWTPFAHVQATVSIKAPIFVARQLGKHQIGLVWNEVSRRYIDSAPEFYMPSELRLKAANVKQGSSDAVLDKMNWQYDEANYLVAASAKFYEQLLSAGVCPEQARMFLPQNMMTEWYWTGSLVAFARVCNLRLDPHTQKECRDVAALLKQELNEESISVSWKALTGGYNG